MTQTFSVRSNAIRNARSKLGKGAKVNVHFNVKKVETPDNKPVFTWEPIENAPSVEVVAAAVPAPEAPEVPEPAKPVAKSKKEKKVNIKATKAVRHYLSKRKGSDDVRGKRLKLIRMITSNKGASLTHLMSVLGWQAHTVRGAISTAKDQKIIKNLKSVRDENRGRVYKAEKVVIPAKKAA